MKIAKKLSLLTALVAICSPASAQEAFKHLSIGLEAGTTGAGVELALPIVKDHLVIKAGYNFPRININVTEPFETAEIADLVVDVNRQLQKLGIDDRLENRFGNTTTINVKAKANFCNAKMMLEYYPARRSSFHITAGFYAGNADLVTADGFTTEAFWSDVKATQVDVRALKAKYADVPGVQDVDVEFIDNMKGTVGGETYKVTEKNGCANIAADLKIAKFRPYFGIGVGRSVPKGHFGVQGDFGVSYHGKPVIESPNRVAFDPEAEVFDDADDILALIQKVCVYPQISVRFIYRIF